MSKNFFNMSKTFRYQKDTHILNGQFQNNDTKSCIAK